MPLIFSWCQPRRNPFRFVAESLDTFRDRAMDALRLMRVRHEDGTLTLRGQRTFPLRDGSAGWSMHDLRDFAPSPEAVEEVLAYDDRHLWDDALRYASGAIPAAPVVPGPDVLPAVIPFAPPPSPEPSPH
jgi:hypothetical protein